MTTILDKGITSNPPTAYLDVVEHGRGRHKTVPLHVHTRLLCGRGARISLPHEAGFSRDHLEFYVVQFDENTMPLCYVRDRQSVNGIHVNGQRVGTSKQITPGRLLLDGDTINVPGRATSKPAEFEPCLTFKFRQPSSTPQSFRLSHTQELETKLFSAQFEITDRVIGDGAHAKVYLALDKRSSLSKQVVCRVMDIGQLTSFPQPAKTLKRWRQEIEITRQLRHPNIVAYLHAIQSPHTIYGFSELASGGDLFSFVSHRDTHGPPLREGDMKMITWQIIQGIKYLHESGVVHRDLKPENILFAVRPSPDYRIVIGDFGHAGLTRHRLTSQVGTEQYISPELGKSRHEHDRPVDMWSLGVILLFLLDSEDCTRNRTGLHRYEQASVDTRIDGTYSQATITPRSNMRDLINGCLRVRASDRITAVMAEQHSWFEEPKHQKRLTALKHCIKTSWDAKEPVFPVLKDLPNLVALEPRARVSDDTQLENMSSQIPVASQYFSNLLGSQSSARPGSIATSKSGGATKKGEFVEKQVVQETPPKKKAKYNTKLSPAPTNPSRSRVAFPRRSLRIS